MTAHLYSEDQLVEQPAIGLFAALDWQTVAARPHPGPLPGGEGVLVDESGLLGRETRGEVVLVERLRAALARLNAGLPAAAIQTAVDELTRDRSAMSLEAVNREVYRLLKEGIAVEVAEALTPAPLPKGEGSPGRSACAWWIGSGRRTTTFCWSASSAWSAASTPAGPIWWALSTACPGW